MTNRVIKRLAYEGFHFREVFAVLKTLEAVEIRIPFLVVTGMALQSDVLVRLICVLEWKERVGAFWASLRPWAGQG